MAVNPATGKNPPQSDEPVLAAQAAVPGSPNSISQQRAEAWAAVLHGGTTKPLAWYGDALERLKRGGTDVSRQRAELTEMWSIFERQKVGDFLATARRELKQSAYHSGKIRAGEVSYAHRLAREALLLIERPTLFDDATRKVLRGAANDILSQGCPWWWGKGWADSLFGSFGWMI